MKKGCFLLRDKDGNTEEYPVFENLIDEVVLKSGNMVSTGVLSCLGYWDIDVLVLSRRGRPVAMMKSMEDDSHVLTRVAQYKAFLDKDKSCYIAKQILLSKIEGQNMVLNSYGLKLHKGYEEKIKRVEPDNYRKRLLALEGSSSKRYFTQVLRLIPESIRPDTRKRYQAFDGVNNLFNVAYEFMSWKVHRTLIRAKLEPFLGFLHALKFSRPSLLCDMKELYRYLIDVFVINYSQDLTEDDFTTKFESISRKRMGKREYLKDSKTNELMNKLYEFLQITVKYPRIYHGDKQTIETLINEECMYLAQYLRGDIKSWNPRIIKSLNY